MLYLLNRIEIPADVEHKAAVMIEGSVIDAEAWNLQPLVSKICFNVCSA